ncbi:MAG TPA: glycosyltransferase family 4 protein [bacterium]|nr:glycosyltransferase family 4 protein [bacterium]
MTPAALTPAVVCPRLAVLCASYGRVRRGIETVVRELCLERLGRDWPVDLYGPPEAPELPAPHRTIRVSCAPRESTAARRYAGLLAGTRWPLAGAHDYEALHFTARLADTCFWSEPYRAVFNYAGPAAALLCRAKRAWDGSAFIHSGQAGMGPVEVAQAAVGPDWYVPLSPPARDWLAGKRLLAPLAPVVPNGVDLVRYAPGPGRDLGLPRPVALFAGALDEMKRPLLAIAAAARAGMALAVAGDGPQRDEVCQRGGELLGDRFRYLGAVAETEMPALYNAAEVFVLPSFEEPFGIVLLEAMACNKPVVTQDDAVRRWLIGDAGMLVECTDTVAFAAALRAAAGCDWQDRLRQRAQRFDWDIVAGEYRRWLRAA